MTEPIMEIAADYVGAMRVRKDEVTVDFETEEGVVRVIMPRAVYDHAFRDGLDAVEPSVKDAADEMCESCDEGYCLEHPDDLAAYAEPVDGSPDEDAFPPFELEPMPDPIELGAETEWRVEAGEGGVLGVINSAGLVIAILGFRGPDERWVAELLASAPQMRAALAAEPSLEPFDAAMKRIAESVKYGEPSSGGECLCGADITGRHAFGCPADPPSSGGAPPQTRHWNGCHECLTDPCECGPFPVSGGTDAN